MLYVSGERDTCNEGGGIEGLSGRGHGAAIQQVDLHSGEIVFGGFFGFSEARAPARANQVVIADRRGEGCVF